MTPTQRLACLLFAAALIAGCGKSEEASAEAKGTPSVAAKESPSPLQPGATRLVVLAPEAPELKQMTVEPVRIVSVPHGEVTSTARIESNPNRVGRAAMAVPGRVARLMVKLGDSVTKGQPLLAIESAVVAEAESGHRQAESSVRQAELALAKAEADMARLADLFEHQAVAQKEVLAAKTVVAIGQASVDQAKSGRDQALRRLEILGLVPGKLNQQIVVTSPLAGKVMEVSVAEGEFRNEINVPLITITDLSRVWATSEVPESQIRYCKVGGFADLELIAYPDEVFRARVTRIADVVNSETRTIKVSAELDNPGGRLRPEMYGRLRYADGVAPVPWIPEAAVVRSGSSDFVFVEQAPGRFLLSQVELGKSHEGGFAVTKGLRGGQRIVTHGAVYLKAAM